MVARISEFGFLGLHNGNIAELFELLEFRIAYQSIISQLLNRCLPALLDRLIAEPWERPLADSLHCIITELFE